MSTRILYVDDEQDLVEIASVFFEEEGLTLDKATNFEGGLQLLRNNSYDLIISDVKMPTGTGHELIQIARQEGFKGKVVLLTGSTEELKGPFSQSYDLILIKPIEFENVVQRVKELLAI